MKICLLNYSGNTGKSTLARHLLAPRMPDARLIAVESINTDAAGEELFRGKFFSEIYAQILKAEDAVIDVGSSNVEEFLQHMRRFRGSHQDLDLFLIPAVPDFKQLQDTLETIEFLANDMNVEAGRIRVVFNRLDENDAVEDVFGGLLAYEQDEKKFASLKTPVYMTDIFKRLKSANKSIEEILSDTEDPRARVQAAKNEAEQNQAIRMLLLHQLAPTAKENLDAVFDELLGSLDHVERAQ